MTRPLAFISYRRADSSAAARWLADSIARTFGAQSVFIDTETVRIADGWSAHVEDALRRSTLFVPVMGPRWLALTDADRRRRIDDADDWVHREIRHALRERKRILPILLSQTPMPGVAALPGPLAGLARFQGLELCDEHWASNLATVLAEMERLGFERCSAAELRYPVPMLSLRELTPEEIAEGLERLPGWMISPPGQATGMPSSRAELTRTFGFASFPDAIRFMHDAVPRIEQLQHHPRWENVWRSVSVHLSTWDIGHRPSRLDFELAGQLDSLYAQFPGARTRDGRAPRQTPEP